MCRRKGRNEAEKKIREKRGSMRRGERRKGKGRRRARRKEGEKQICRKRKFESGEGREKIEQKKKC